MNPSAYPASAAVTPVDRLGLTLFFSAVLHGIVILGIVFAKPDPAKAPTVPTLDIILTQNTGVKQPDDADYLSQANQDGNGNVRQRVHPTVPRSAPLSSPAPGQGDLISPPRQAATPQTARAPEVLTADEKSIEQAATPAKEQTQPQSAMPSAAELMIRSKEIAKLSADLNDSLQAYTRRPRQRYVSARSRSFRDAAYLESWRDKIERIGNLNYPEEAKREGLSGSLILDVALNADGTVHNIELRRSSGYKLLDDAAIRIVRLAAPFAPFSAEMRKDTDILHITRTWQFLDDNSFSSGM